MDEEERVVYSAGNSWVVCRSKSHAGRIYYFNTLTGEAAWNLSDAEKEKAKTTTSNLKNSINIEECPEPQEPPMDQPKETAKVFQTSQTSSTMCQFEKPAYTMPNILVPPFNQLVANPINAILPFAINAQNPGYNSNVWAVPPTHQIFFGPTLSPLLNQGHSTSVNVAYGNQAHTVTVQNATTSLSNRFQELEKNDFNTSPQKKFQRWSKFSPPNKNNRFKEKKYGYKKEFKNNLGLGDLRQVLSAKKRERRASFSSESYKETTTGIAGKADFANKDSLFVYKPEPSDSGESNVDHSEETLTEKNEPNDADSDWLEENILVENGKIKLNVSNLKEMAKPEMDPECWYIVADKHILLSHLNFLSILCNSDDDCRLMVPRQVMADLRDVSRASDARRTASRARRALAFIRQYLDAGYVDIGDGTCEENDTRCDYILDCCSNLTKKHYHVILLSDDEEFELYKDTTSIPIFNIKEIKHFLAKCVPEQQPSPLATNECQKKDRLKPPPLCKIKPVPQTTNLPIKITVDNDLLQKNDENLLTCNINIGTQIDDDVVTVDKSVAAVLDETQTVNHEDVISRDKYTNEAGVQTDDKIDSTPSVSNDTTIFTKFCLSEDAEKALQREHETSDCVISTQLGKKDKRLNRSISVKRSEDSCVGNKKFKWRRRRNASATVTNYNKTTSASSPTVDENSRDAINTQQNNKETDLIAQGLLHNKSEESVSSETSSLLITRNLTNNSVVVDETSTSGIISNSTSNADSGSENGNKRSYKFNFKSPQEPLKSVMFKITDKTMEDSLRTMIDEWVSRFLQIMEEVLTQVLRKDQQFLCDIVYKLHGGGPWNIREASDCIKIKYINNSDVVDAANKLTNIFMRISDHTGMIVADLCPSGYMEMYSAGVYLVKSLQRAAPACDDARAAALALATLLDDIRDPRLDASHGDAFADPQDTNDNIAKPATPVQSPKSFSKQAETTPTKQINRECNETAKLPNSSEKSGDYNLRSKIRSLPQINNDAEIKNQENGIQNSFFNSLHLMKKSSESHPDHQKITKTVTRTVSNKPDMSSKSQVLLRSIFDRILNENSQKTKQDSSTTEATVVRNFKTCAEFENKLKKSTQREPLDMDQLDYSIGEDNDGYYSDDEYHGSEQDLQIDEPPMPVSREESIKDDGFIGNGGVMFGEPAIEMSENCDRYEGGDSEFIYNSPLNISYNLNNIFSTVIGRVKGALLDVQSFCQDTFIELDESKMHSIKRKYEINENAERAQKLLDCLCESLNGVFHRETYEPENNIQSLLKQAGINDFSLDDNQLNLYRDMIDKCLQQARTLQESITLIMLVLKKQPIK